MQEAEKIWMNGALVDWHDAEVRALTHALHYGTAVFEGIRSYATDDGAAVFRLDDHLARLERSAAMYYMPIPFSREELRQAVHQLLGANELGSCYIRPLVMRGYGTMGLFPLEAPVDVTIAVWGWGSYIRGEGKEKGIRPQVSSWRRISPDSLIPHAKASGQYLNSILAKIESHKAGYEEAILLDDKGYVCEGSGENIFVVRDGKILTPPQTASILDGINRKSIIQIARDLGFEVVERDIARGELYLADEVFVSGTAAELTPLREVDDHTVGEGRPGEITRAIQDVFEDALHGRAERYREWLDPVPVETVAPVGQRVA